MNGERVPPVLVKAVDAWWTVLIVDPVAVPLTRFLGRATNLSATTVTLAAAAVGLGSIGSFYAALPVLGALLFELRFILDCVDGKLARLNGQSSARGAMLDITSDVMTTALLFVVVGVFQNSTELGLVVAIAYLFQYWTWEYRRTVTQDITKVALGGDIGESSGLRRWLQNRRLSFSPRSVDVENILFFILPMIPIRGVLAIGLVCAGVFYAFGATRNLAGTFRALGS